jgi:cytochrome b561
MTQTYNTPNLPLQKDWQYSRTAVALHWLLALLITGVAGVGWYMMEIEDEPGSGWYFANHKSVGIVIALLVVARLAWRLVNRPQPLPDSVPIWQARLATATQALLYLAMFLMPLTGYLGASYSKQGVQFFGMATPAWALPDHDTAERFFDIHGVLIWVLVALVAAHVLGALKHLFIDKDGVFERMRFRAPH